MFRIQKKSKYRNNIVKIPIDIVYVYLKIKVKENSNWNILELLEA